MDTRRLTDERLQDLIRFHEKWEEDQDAPVPQEFCGTLKALRELKSLRAEAAELATVMERLARYTKQWHPDMKSDEPCIVYTAWQKSQELLSRPTVVELRKEKD